MDLTTGIDVAQQVQSAYEQAHYQLQTPEGLSIGLGVVAGILAAGTTAIIQARRSKVLPCLPTDNLPSTSESDAATFYRNINDIAMIVTDAWNQSQAYGGKFSTFRERLHMSPLRRYAQQAKDGANGLLKQIAPQIALGEDAQKVAEVLDAVWEYESDDHYRTESYYDFSSKSFKTRSVYDNTDHYFTFHKDRAMEAAELLTAIAKSYAPSAFPDLGVGEIDETPSDQDKERIRSTIIESHKATVLDEQAHELCNEWNEKASAAVILPTVRKNLEELLAITQADTTSLTQAQPRYHYNTGSRSHDGPQQYQFADDLKDRCSGIANQMRKLTEDIEQCVASATELAGIAAQRGQPTDKKALKPKKLARHAVDLAIESYLVAFPDSKVDIDQRSYAGMTAGIGIGAGAIVGIGAYLIQVL